MKQRSGATFFLEVSPLRREISVTVSVFFSGLEHFHKMTHPTACPCLWIAEPCFPEPDGFPNLWFHGYLLICPGGNLLVHTREHEAGHDAIAELDGVSPRHLAHGHEAERGSQTSDNASGAHHLLIVRPVDALLVEKNDEWAVQRARYMTLETMSQMSDDPLISLPPLAG